jgi:hypothetical protein
MSSEVETEHDVGVTREEALTAGKNNMNFFGALCLPDVFRFNFPPIFLAVWQMLTEAASRKAGQDRLAIGLPRGFGKTLVLKLFVLWCILFTDRKFILVVCNTASLAENFIADVVDTLNSSNIVRVFGNWQLAVEKDTQPLKKFSFRGRPITLAALGSQSSVRGLNLKYERPDVIIMDDMQSKEEAASPTEAQKTLGWMTGTLLKANNKQRCLSVFLGNMYPYEGSILKKLRTNSQWVSFICGAILADGQSIWPELRSVEDILEELDHDEQMGQPEIFYSEVMNDDAAGTRSGIDFSKVNLWQESAEEPDAGFVIIDPSAGKKKSDDVAIGAVLCWHGEPVLRELKVGRFNPLEQCDEAIKLAAKHGLNAIVVEDVAYQATLCFWMQRRLMQFGLTGIRILTINPGGEKKPTRIKEMLKQLTAQQSRIWLHRDVRSVVIHQITYYDPMKSNNKDDILDILAYLWKVIAKYPYEIRLVLDIVTIEVGASFSDQLNTEF